MGVPGHHWVVFAFLLVSASLMERPHSICISSLPLPGLAFHFRNCLYHGTLLAELAEATMKHRMALLLLGSAEFSIS